MEVAGTPTLPRLEVITQKKLHDNEDGVQIKSKSNEYLKN
jgi:hypothetical protein